MRLRRRRIGAYGVCRDHDRVLLVRGSGGAHAAAMGTGGEYWLLPGGGVEHGEHPAVAVVREFREETGLTVSIVGPRSVDFDLLVLPDELLHHDRVVYDVTAAAGTLAPEVGGSSDRVRWFSGDELAELPVTPFTAAILGAGRSVLAPLEDPAALVADSEPAPTAEPVQRFAAYGLVTAPDDRILLTRIAPGYPGAGSWHLPGGGTDFGESATVGLLRELAEETGQVGTVGDLLAIEHFHNPAAYGPEKRPIDWHTVRSVFRVIVTRPTPPVIQDLGGSTDAVGWFTRTELRGLDLNRLARTVISVSRQ
jgi:ADP-ribose pyrophosphatase YjhB (NUDIX family)